jgi:glycosyltransferase involved in cell wall biosynthesis
MNKPTFLFFGAIKPYKGLDLLRKAVEELQPLQDCFNLIIAGGGKDENLDYFKSQNNSYVLNRFLENDEMMHLINISSVVVLPYHTASQSGIIPTIALFDKPCIATGVGAFPEMVCNGINGLVTEPENPHLFAEAMRNCITDNSLLTKLQHGMKNFGSGDDYDWAVIAKRTIDFCLNK